MSERFTICRIICWIVIVVAGTRGSAIAQEIGLPPRHFYSLDEVTSITSGFRIGFDPLGRIAVAQNNKYQVLNDDEWINLIEEGEGIEHALIQIGYASDNQAYFASNGHWGKLVKSEKGRFIPVSMSPDRRPAWTKTIEFTNVLVVDEGVFFYNWRGLVYLDRATGEYLFREILGLEQIFRFKGRWYASVIPYGFIDLNLETEAFEFENMPTLFSGGLKGATLMNPDNVVCYSPHAGLFLFDGEKTRQWGTFLDELGDVEITSVCCLKEGNVAVAVRGRGIYVLSQEGRNILSLTGAEFQNVEEVISNEEGVLWYSTDAGLGRVNYGSNVMVLNQSSGLRVSWPQIALDEQGIWIVTSGKTYHSVRDRNKGSTSFELLEDQPPGFNLAVASVNGDLLVGSREGVFVKNKEKPFSPVLLNMDVARVVSIDQNLCYIIGPEEITAIHRNENRWIEDVERISGFGFPSVVHKIGEAVWIELGVNRAARIILKDGKLTSMLFEEFPWDKPVWVNIGSIGNIVILSGGGFERLYFDEEQECFCENTRIDAILDLCPYGVWRTVEDADGTIWVSTYKGISALRLEDEHYHLDMRMADGIWEPTPILRLIGNDLWAVSRNSLYHIRKNAGSISEGILSEVRPRLDCVADARTGILLDRDPDSCDFGELGFESNSLRFRFFSSSYALEDFEYEVDMQESFSRWSLSNIDSDFILPSLKEGNYNMQVRLVSSGLLVGDPLVLRFTILPPWYRTKLAYGLYGLVAVLLAALFASIPILFIRRQNRVLTCLVNERTQVLEKTMIRLKEDERNLAVHEERSRIANEIHDSVQQGLGGLKLMLDSALTSNSLTQKLREHLMKAATIVDFTHQELTHAIWNMQTQLLVDGDLRQGLEKIASLVDSASQHIEVLCDGQPYQLPSSTNHHLLRIAQESITNAVRHGRAQSITLSLDYSPSEFTLKIVDDGCGFNLDEVKKNPYRIGLKNMISRVKRFDGVVDIFSNIGKGTCIVVKIVVHKS